MNVVKGDRQQYRTCQCDINSAPVGAYYWTEDGQRSQHTPAAMHDATLASKLTPPQHNSTQVAVSLRCSMCDVRCTMYDVRRTTYDVLCYSRRAELDASSCRDFCLIHPSSSSNKLGARSLVAVRRHYAAL